MNLDRHIRDTAHAWGLTIEHVYKIYDWLERVPPYRRYYALTKILRKEHAKLRKKPKKETTQLTLL